MPKAFAPLMGQALPTALAMLMGQALPKALASAKALASLMGWAPLMGQALPKSAPQTTCHGASFSPQMIE